MHLLQAFDVLIDDKKRRYYNIELRKSRRDDVQASYSQPGTAGNGQREDEKR